MVDSNLAMQQLFHMPEGTFGSLSLFAFFLPYFIGGSITNGILLPGGLFVPTLLAGALFGRIFGHGLSAAFPGQVSTPGSYALLGAAAVLGGMSRMTIAGTVIVLEACGNNEYLLPLMLVFAAARYTANAINMPMYDMMIDMKGLPFLERELPTTGMLNYNNVSAIMAKRVVCLKNVNRVSDIFDILCSTKHNGYPVVDDDNRLKGIILRKTLVIILKIRAFSRPIVPGSPECLAAERAWDPAKGPKPPTPRGYVELTQCPTIAYDSLEKNYPKYPQIEDVKLEPEDLDAWIDLRSYMDPSPYSLTEAASVLKSYRMFRSMGLRHLIITDSDHRVTGMLTRHDITEKKLAHEWRHNADDKNYYSVSLRSPAFVPESEVGEIESGGRELASSTGSKSSLTQRAVTGKDK
jgi:chloride channel 7